MLKLAYLDTSAFMKLVAVEEFSPQMRAWAEANDARIVSSELLRVEALRAARRLGEEFIAPVREAIRATHLSALSRGICELAGELSLGVVRSLDAIHLAAALALGDDLECVVAYDERLIEGCRALGLPVVQPGIGAL